MPHFRHTPGQVAEGRRRGKVEYGKLFEEVEVVLFAYDPIGLIYGPNVEEYAPEAGTILVRMPECDSAEEAAEVVHEEFVHWFGEEIAGTSRRYSTIGAEIWHLWQQFKDAKPVPEPVFHW